MTDTITLLRAEIEAVKDALAHARNIAMEQTMKAHIPECGEFGAIAQNLDWVLNVALAQQSSQVAQKLKLVCIANDPLCPCQDGDACHYKALGETEAMLAAPPPKGVV
jgi:hypothetical protein